MARRRGAIERGARGFYAVASVLDAAGVRHRPRHGPFPTRREAESALGRMLADIDGGSFVLAHQTPLGDYLNEWLATHRVTLKPSTAHGYEGVIARYVTPVLGGVPLANLRSMHLSNLYAAMIARDLSPRTVRTVHVVVRRALADGVRDGLLARNVADGASLPRISHMEQHAWSADEARTFLAKTADDPHNTLFLVALATGMRRGELAGLRWEDVDLSEGIVLVRRTRTVVGGQVVDGEPKTATSRRVVELDPATVAALRRWRIRQKPNAHVFPDYPDRLSKAWDAAVARTGVRRIPFHGARHTAASLMLQAGIPVNVVSRRLGHASPMVTLTIYAHVLPGQGRDAADRLGAVLTWDGASQAGADG